MPYQPGPIKLQTSEKVGIVQTEYNFSGDVTEQLGDLETIPAGWVDFLDDVTSLMKEPSDPFPEVDLSAAISTLHAYSDPDALLGTSAMITALGDADLALGSAIGYAPAEAWIDTAGGFVAPGPAETLGVPFIPPGDISFLVTGTAAATGSTIVLPPPDKSLGTAGGATTPIPTGVDLGPLVAASATLTNTSQYGSTDFRVGDQFQLTVTGPVGQGVYVYATLNGEDIGGGHQGDIGPDGKLVITNTMGEGQVGVWTEQVWVGQSRLQTFAFIVVPA